MPYEINTATKLALQWKNGVTKAGKPAYRTRSFEMRNDITEEKCRSFIDCINQLTESPVVGAKLITKKTTKIWTPEMREEKLEEENEGVREEIQVQEQDAARREDPVAVPSVFGESSEMQGMEARKDAERFEIRIGDVEGVQKMEFGMSDIELSALEALGFRATPLETTAETGYVAPLSYFDIPGYAEQTPGF